MSDQPKEGLRYNQGKIDLSQLSPVARMLESLIFQYGECKYRRDNWKNFKVDEKKAYIEFIQCAQRHILAYERGEFFDSESKMPHLAHAVWNLNRIMDLYYYGKSHDPENGKDLYHQPLRNELPPTPTKDNFAEIWGFEYQNGGKKVIKE
jgi:hypothetical protein